jgi:uncharacterized glyoxalase superfamily protein PhnB
MRLEKTTPILRIFDEQMAKAFYVDFLGFRVDWEHRFEANMPVYMQVSRGDCVIHLSEHFGDCSPGAAMRIQTDDLATFRDELATKHSRYTKPGIETMPWGTTDMRITDPFGNRLTFTNAISV